MRTLERWWWMTGLVTLALASGCATAAQQGPRRAVSIVEVTASTGATPANDALQRQLRGWEERSAEWLRDRLTAKGYRVAQRFDPGGSIMWSLRIEVVEGNRETRVATLGEEGHGAIKVTLAATAWGAERYHVVAEGSTSGHAYGLGLGRVLEEVLERLDVPQASHFDSPPAAR